MKKVLIILGVQVLLLLSLVLLARREGAMIGVTLTDSETTFSIFTTSECDFRAYATGSAKTGHYGWYAIRKQKFDPAGWMFENRPEPCDATLDKITADRDADFRAHEGK